MYRHVMPGKKGLAMCSLAKLMGDNLRHTRLSRYFCCRIIAGYACVAAMVVTMVAIFILGQLLKVRWAGKPAIRWELL